MERRRVIATVLLIMILIPFIYLLIEMNHNCIEDECNICTSITECETFLKKIIKVMIYSVSIMAIECLFLRNKKGYTFMFRHNTLVSDKVRLDN